MSKGEKTEFERFSEATKHLLSVSKEELNRREAEWKKGRKRKRKASKKPTERAASRDSGGDSA
jgi:hypothetical protein